MTSRRLRPWALATALAMPAALTLPSTAVVAQGAGPDASAAAELAPGTALVRVTGDVQATLLLPVVPGTAAPTDTGFELRFQDAAMDTLNVTLEVQAGQVTDTFLGVGVPGTSIFDDAYFADFLRTQCRTTVLAASASGIHAAIDCVGLQNGAGDMTVDVRAELTTVGLPSPSASPEGGPAASTPASAAPASSPGA